MKNLLRRIFSNPDASIEAFKKLSAKADDNTARVSTLFAEAATLGENVVAAKHRFLASLSDQDFGAWLAADEKSRNRLPLLNELGRLRDHVCRRVWDTEEGRTVARKALLAVADQLDDRASAIDDASRSLSIQHCVDHSPSPTLGQLALKAKRCREISDSISRNPEQEYSGEYVGLLRELTQ